jgi:hypothetical protein
MRRARLMCGLGALTGSLAITPIAAAQQSGDSVGPVAATPPSVWQATVGTAAVNILPWAYNWYVQRWPWARIGSRVWGKNFRAGFSWDDDCFLDNHLAHPYHGSLYLNSARVSGFGFWGALPYVAAGSATWELLLENVRPSINDLVNTTLGGMALGEVTFRLSSLLVSNHGSGLGSIARELGAFALSPIGRAQGLLRDQDRGSTRSPESPSKGWIAAGRHASRSYIIVGFEYGSPFDSLATRPYDAFDVSLEVIPEEGSLVRHLTISGLLTRRSLRRTRQNEIGLGLYQHYDYHDLRGIDFSGQSLSGALLIQEQLGSRAQLRFGTQLEAVLLGAISADQGQYFRRDYDYGSGAGGRLSSSLRLDGRDLLRLEGRLVWLHSLYGSRADHMITGVRLAALLHPGGILGLGGDLGVTTRQSWYSQGSPVRRRVPETRVYLMWPP